MSAIVDIVSPADEREAEEIVRHAAAFGVPMEIVGGGTRRGLGRPAQTSRTVSTARLAGITLHEPAELVIAARAGTPLAEVEAALDAVGQRLPFEPVDMRPLLGTAGTPTIGAVAACNTAGPRRIQAGAARDHLIGIRMVTGRGETIRSGGRVMKNVTGLDFVKLAAGAYGTLGLISEVTFKTLPRPATETTLLLEGLDDARAIAALSAGLCSPYEVTGAAHLPGAPAQTAMRLEGFDFSVEHRATALAKLLKGFGRVSRLDPVESRMLWREIRDAGPVIEPREHAVWRISTRPSDGPPLVAALQDIARAHFYDWGGGLVWLAVDATGDAGAFDIRAAIKPLGGHATLVRAPDHIRIAAEVFEPLPAPLMKVTRDLKRAFDPGAVLNPGRMYAGV